MAGVLLRLARHLLDGGLDLLLPEGGLEQRRRHAPARPDHPAPGMLAAYRERVGGAEAGAVWL